MPAPEVALVLAAHGDRGSAARNAVLCRHASSLKDKFRSVSFGVLNGEPRLGDALAEAECTDASLIVVYPFFMSGGYFVSVKLAREIERAKLAKTATVLPPLGHDPALPPLLLEHSVGIAKAAAYDPAVTRILIAGHGSKFGRASAEATEAAAEAVRRASPFAKVATAFLEEPPFLADMLQTEKMPAVVAGFFSGEGMHGHDDVPQIMEKSGVPCIYTRPIGSHPQIPMLIEAAVRKAIDHLLL